MERAPVLPRFKTFNWFTASRQNGSKYRERFSYRYSTWLNATELGTRAHWKYFTVWFTFACIIAFKLPVVISRTRPATISPDSAFSRWKRGETFTSVSARMEILSSRIPCVTTINVSNSEHIFSPRIFKIQTCNFNVTPCCYPNAHMFQIVISEL